MRSQPSKSVRVRCPGRRTLLGDDNTASDLQKPNRVAALCLAVVAILLVAAAGKLLLNFVLDHGVLHERSRLKARTIAIAGSLDVESIRTLTGRPADERTPGFRQLAMQLRSYRMAHGDVRFVYLMGLKDNEVIFLLDSADPSSFDYSPPGEVYQVASPELVRSFTTGEPFVEGPLTDRWGSWVSGLRPINDPSSNRVIAVLGLDVDATRWRITLGVYRALVLLLTGALAWIVVSCSMRFQRRFTN
jgi:hypothetical protein